MTTTRYNPPPSNEPALGSRVTGAVAGAVAGSILPLGPLGTVGGAVVGAVLGPKSRLINKASDSAVRRLGQWAGRR